MCVVTNVAFVSNIKRFRILQQVWTPHGRQWRLLARLPYHEVVPVEDAAELVGNVVISSLVELDVKDRVVGQAVASGHDRRTYQNEVVVENVESVADVVGAAAVVALRIHLFWMDLLNL